MRKLMALLLVGIVSGCDGWSLEIRSSPPTPQWVAAFPRLPLLSGLVGLHQAPGDSSSFYAVRKSGHVLRFSNQSGASSAALVLDVSARVLDSGESGLLGLAFHPQFASNGRLYVYYTGGSPLTSYLSRFVRRSDGSFHASDEEILLTVAQPFSNHNGGQLAFGPDGYLYLALGDGGSGGDPFGNAQNTNVLLGKILRLDVDGTAPYAIPPDNPFAGGGGRPEIWAYGLRNPWRFSFDRGSGALWAADVGEDDYEEINKIVRGGNYGWAIMEGTSCFNGTSCNPVGLIPPVFAYDHREGCSVTGGYVYRGAALPALQGRYLFTDFCSGKVWSLQLFGGTVQSGMLETLPGSPASLAEDYAGELYALDFGGDAGANIYKLVPGR